jgi:hypothetical protein
MKQVVSLSSGYDKSGCVWRHLRVTTRPRHRVVFVLTQKLPESSDKWLKVWGKCGIIDMPELAVTRGLARLEDTLTLHKCITHEIQFPSTNKPPGRMGGVIAFYCMVR